MALNFSQVESKMISDCLRLFLFLSLTSFVSESRQLNGNSYKLSSSFSKSHHVNSNGIEGKIWAILIAGSRGYANYRHQVTLLSLFHITPSNNLINLSSTFFFSSSFNRWHWNVFLIKDNIIILY